MGLNTKPAKGWGTHFRNDASEIKNCRPLSGDDSKIKKLPPTY